MSRATPVMLMGAFSAALGAAFSFPVFAAIAGVWVRVRHLPKAHRVAAFGPAWHHWLVDKGYLPWHALGPLWTVPHLAEAWGLTAVAVGVLGGAWMAAKIGSARRPELGGPPVAGKGEHGTSRWASAVELAATYSRWQALPDRKASRKPAEPPPSGILLGQAGRGAAWVHQKEEHIILVGRPGSGKSRGVILPTLGVIGTAGTESVLVTDPKGELYAHSADWFRARGYTVQRFDLRDPSRSLRWNPLDPVVAALTEDRRDLAATMAWDIGHLLAGASGDQTGGDRYWSDTAESLIAALILAVAQGRPTQTDNPPPGEDPWTWPALAERHLGTVYAALVASGEGGERLDALFGQYPLTHPARQAYGPIAVTVDRNRASILSTAMAALRLWSSVGIQALTASTDHKLDELGRGLTATFLVIPDERSTLYPLANLYISQTLQSLAALADVSGGRLPVPTSLILDEFGNLPRLPDFDKTVAVARGRGIRLLMAVQDLAQLERHYGKATAGTIKGSSGIWVYLSTGDIQTAKEISDKTGDYTVSSENQSVPKVSWWTTPGTVGTASSTLSLTRRRLLTDEEVLRWPLGQALVLHSGHHPAQLPLPGLSAWAGVWPDLQQPHPAPPSVPVTAPSIWHPPSPTGEEGPADDGYTSVPAGTPVADRSSEPESEATSGPGWTGLDEAGWGGASSDSP